MNWIIKHIDSIKSGDLDYCLSLMDFQRKKHIDGFLSERRKALSVVAELTAKKLAAEFLNLNIEKIELLRAENGKPYIKGNPAYISISHSGDFVAAAVSEKPIGIDIEIIKEKDLDFTKKLFCDSDLEFINSESDSLTAFYKVWTAKEAYLKAFSKSFKEAKDTPYKALSPVHYFENGVIITIIKNC